MKLANLSINCMMQDPATEDDGSLQLSDNTLSLTAVSQNQYLQLTPSANSSQVVNGTKLRRNTVATACERCRKRKTKCSGLPGPCMNCVRLGVTCHEPGRRKSSLQSTLEERFQRSRALQTANHATMLGHPMRMTEGHSVSTGLPVKPEWMSNAQVPGLADQFSVGGSHPIGAPLPTPTYNYKDWRLANGPISYLDNQSQGALDWTMSDLPSESESVDSNRSGRSYETRSSLNIHSQSQNNSVSTNKINVAVVAENVVSFDEAQTCEKEHTPIGFVISYDSTFFDDPEEEQVDFATGPSSAIWSSQAASSICLNEELQAREASTLASEPFTKSLSTPIAQPLNQSPGSFTEQKQQSVRIQTLSTSSATTMEPEQQEMDLLNLITCSTDTQRYITKYFSTVHTTYPFLDPALFGDRNTFANQLGRLNVSLMQVQAMIQFQTLFVAAIGALIQHESIDLASQYVRQAVLIRDQLEMWSSICGVHCAILPALYCYLAEELVYNTECDRRLESQQAADNMQTSRCPVSNLWLHNCQIAAACIDLGIHQPSTIQEQMFSQPNVRSYLDTCRDTFRSAYVLDRKISNLRKRPRAFHDSDIDETLLTDTLSSMLAQ